MYRQDNTVQSFDQRPHRGVIAYHKHCKFQVQHSVQHSACDMVCAVVTTKYLALNVIAVYRSPQLPMARFLQLLDSSLKAMPSDNVCIIAGDFNVDIKGITSDVALKLALQDGDHHLKALVQFMLMRGLSQLLSAPTVDSNMQIDHIWTNLPCRLQHMKTSPFVLDTFYSDHRAVGLQATSPE